MRPDVKVEYNS